MGMQIYDGVSAVYAALNKYLSSGARKRSSYFFGETFTSLDALLFGHLVYHSHAPVAAPELRQAVRLRLLIYYLLPSDCVTSGTPALLIFYLL